MTRKPRRLTPAPEGLSHLVPHPRYGTAPSRGSLSNAEQAEADRWLQKQRWFGTVYWIGSAIPADATRQGNTYGPHRYYVDRACVCVDCQRPFIFYAREQQFWFETLGFNVGSRALRCTECRRNARALKAVLREIEPILRRLKAQAGPITRDVLDDASLVAVATGLAQLYQAGAYGDTDTLKRLRKALLRRSPADALPQATEAVDTLNRLLGPSKRASPAVEAIVDASLPTQT